MTELIVICDKLHINYHLSSINYHLLSVIYRLSAVQKSFDVFEYTFSDWLLSNKEQNDNGIRH